MSSRFTTQMTQHLDLSRTLEVGDCLDFRKFCVEDPCLLQEGILEACINSNGNELVSTIPVCDSAIHEEKDREAVMHIITSHKVIKIQDLLLIITTPLLNPNSKNDQTGQTEYTHHESYQSPPTQDTILNSTAAVRIRKDPPENHRKTSNSCRSKEQESEGTEGQVKNILIMVLVMAITFFFAAASNPPKDSIAGKETVSIWNLVIGCSPYHMLFYYMISSTAGFSVCVVALTHLMWPLPLQKVINFVLIILIINYIFLVKMSMPYFLISIGSYDISSGNFMGLLTAAFLCCGLVVLVFMEFRGCLRKRCREPVGGELAA